MKIWKTSIALLVACATLVSHLWYACNTGYPLGPNGELPAAAWSAIGRQSFWLFSGGLLCWAVARADYRKWATAAIPLQLVAAALMVLALSDRLLWGWYHFGMSLPVVLHSFYPARWSILSAVVFLAAYSTKTGAVWRFGNPASPTAASLLGNNGILASVLFVNVSLVAATGGVRPALILFTTLLGMALSAARRKAAALFAALCGAATLLYVCSGTYWLARVLAFPYWDTARCKSPPLTQLMLRSGGWLGTGLGSSRYRQYLQPSDMPCFLTPVTAEEQGWLALIATLLCVTLVLLAGAAIALRAPDTFGRRLAGGIVTVLGLQAALHIAFVLDLLPVFLTAVPMPFVSEFGLNAWLPLVCVGLLLSIARHGRREDGP